LHYPSAPPQTTHREQYTTTGISIVSGNPWLETAATALALQLAMVGARHHSFVAELTCLTCLVIGFLWTARGVVVTIRNDLPRLDVNGEYVDAHDGCIVAHNGTYFLYGESYGNVTGGTFPGGWGNAPQLAVYTSPDLVTWTFAGCVAVNVCVSNEGALDAPPT
jgi:hypothetical protein